MPCNVEVWVVDDENWFTVYVDCSLVTEEGAALLESALSGAADQAVEGALPFLRSSWIG